MVCVPPVPQPRPPDLIPIYPGLPVVQSQLPVSPQPPVVLAPPPTTLTSAAPAAIMLPQAQPASIVLPQPPVLVRTGLPSIEHTVVIPAPLPVQPTQPVEHLLPSGSRAHPLLVADDSDRHPVAKQVSALTPTSKKTASYIAFQSGSRPAQAAMTSSKSKPPSGAAVEESSDVGGVSADSRLLHPPGAILESLSKGDEHRPRRISRPSLGRLPSQSEPAHTETAAAEPEPSFFRDHTESRKERRSSQCLESLPINQSPMNPSSINTSLQNWKVRDFNAPRATSHGGLPECHVQKKSRHDRRVHPYRVSRQQEMTCVTEGDQKGVYQSYLKPAASLSQVSEHSGLSAQHAATRNAQSIAVCGLASPTTLSAQYPSPCHTSKSLSLPSVPYQHQESPRHRLHASRDVNRAFSRPRPVELPSTVSPHGNSSPSPSSSPPPLVALRHH